MNDAKPSSMVRTPGPPGNLGLRNLARFVTDQLDLLRDLSSRYGDTVRMKVLGTPWFLISHPDDIEKIMVEHARIMVRDEYVDVLKRVLGLGLLTNDGEPWKRQRRLMAQAFTPKRIREYGTAMARVSEEGVEPWRDGDVINVHQEMSRVTMEIVADVLFGASLSRADVERVRASMEIINEFMANSPEAVVMLPGWVPTPRNVRLNRAVKTIDALLYRIIERRRAGDEVRDDLLGTLLAAQDEGGVGMSDQQLRDEAITLFLAGHETTALAMAHTLYLLALHPEIERRVHAEIDAVIGARRPTAEDVKALEYTGRVLKESMRIYPPAWTTGREAAEELELSGHHIPKGSQILMSQWVVHYDRRWFPNPMAFDPDRWLPERAKGLPKYAYFPFGGGPRVCIGNHFAMMEATLLLAVILQRYQLELLPGQHLELKPSVTLRQKGPGLRMRLLARDRPVARASEVPIASAPTA